MAAGLPFGSLRRALAALLAGVALAGCGSTVKKPTTLEDVRSAAVQEVKAGQHYYIGPGDELEIVFFHTPELNLTLPVRPDGGISVPLAHDVRAAGRTPEELREVLTQSFATELERPEIAVVVRTFAGNRIHVGGEVGKPGVYPLLGSMTALDSVLGAGVLTRTAKLDDVLVIRRVRDDGGFKVITLNLKKVIDGTDPAQNLALAPFDAIFVPTTPIADWDTFVNLYIREAIPINFQLRYNINAGN